MAIPKTPTGVKGLTGLVENVLTWVPVSGATSYKIYRDSGNTAIGTVTSPTFTQLVPMGSNHSYRVTAVNGDGESPLGPVVRIAAAGNAPAHPLYLKDDGMPPRASSSSTSSSSSSSA